MPCQKNKSGQPADISRISPFSGPICSPSSDHHQQIPLIRSTSKPQTNHKGVFLCWAPVSVSCKLISKSPLKKTSLTCNFKIFKKKQLTSPKGSQSWEDNFPGWWFQPIWKILVKLGSSSPIFGVNIKNIWSHHPVPEGTPECPKSKKNIKSSFFQPEVSSFILLMVQKSGFHQLRLVVYPIIYKGFSTIPSGLKSPDFIFTHQRLGTNPQKFPDPSIPEVLTTWSRPQVGESVGISW